MTDISAHTRTVLELISEHFDIDYDDMYNLISLKMRLEKTNVPVRAAELVEIDGKKYLFDPLTRNLYNQNKKPMCVGRLSDDGEAIVRP